MAIVKTKELRAMSEAELHKRLEETRKDLTALRLKARSGAVEQPHRIRTMRRDIARTLTLLRDK